MSHAFYTVRNYRHSDFEDYVKLNRKVESLEPTGRRTSPEELEEYLNRPNHSPEQDTFVVEAAGKIIGLLDITRELNTGRVMIDCLMHPEHPQKGPAKRLLGCAERRARELGAKVMRVNIGENNETAKKVLPELSFRGVRQYLILRLPLDEAVLPDITHHDFICRHLQPGEEGKLTRLQNRCFAGAWEYNPNTTEEIEYSLGLSGCCHEDVILVHEKDKAIGYCWMRINHEAEAADSEKKGRIHMFGVDPDYRRQGIAKMALRTGLTYLKNRGVRVAELDVDNENEAAKALYRYFGFKKWSSILWYEKKVDQHPAMS